MLAQFKAFLANTQPQRLQDVDPNRIDSIEQFAHAVTVFYAALNTAQDPVAQRIRTTLIRLEALLRVWGDSLRVVSEINTVGDALTSDIRKVGSIHYFFSIPATWEITTANVAEIQITLDIVSKMEAIFKKMKQNPSQYASTFMRTVCLIPTAQREYNYKMNELFDSHLLKQSSALLLTPLRIAFFQTVQQLDAQNPSSHFNVSMAFDELISAFSTCFNHIEIFSPYLFTHPNDPQPEEHTMIQDDERDDTEENTGNRRNQHVRELGPLLDDMSTCSDIETRVQKIAINNMLKNMTLCLCLKSLYAKAHDFPLNERLIVKVNQVIDQVNQNNHFEFRNQRHDLLQKHSEYSHWFTHCGLPITDNQLDRYQKPETTSHAPNNM